jgi:hypothetical protein
VPFNTLGDLRLRARILNQWFDYTTTDTDAALDELLEALEKLPQRLWGEPIRKA